ncbi:homoserine O-acetyltransferase [Halomonas sp. MCCC 1A17488]|uniref:Probable acyltransferase n=1 Tax=Billgrantia sulfidoxydans TaxID=2733484 RepID=A0ABX7W9A3_9GAMM|nr:MULTISPECIES: homoserine O-acetyltransferase [Halomonas]MCE8018467.1 homoserine O-acetyltransferase [Halomonas sp. MCCC 1A17488]MCG3241800.1 homoserine O-acetyltransferase [Halomonas sp. MCCC 1A17488]QPP49167.1 homoserine O-acetyltransferase [Halomonas sp. SS10-MC5]QTP56501.1 homoserine O-acetyltransferase [Halomonas sulfidoxydans]
MRESIESSTRLARRHSPSARRLAAPPLVALLLCASASALGWDELVEKQVFEMETYTSTGGETIAPLRIGWEAYGELNEAKDNAILITHFFSGTSHAAGRYAEDDAAPGYWDAIIGPGKPLDTDEYYIIASDTLVNLNAHDPNVTTTGPATTNPETGEPWGTDFPLVTIRDFVEVQKALLESQGIERLHAVMGASMGALQAYEWASAYPERVERLIPVIGGGVSDPWLLATLGAWAAPIRLDANWNGGDYYDGEPPLDGLRESLKLVTLNANHWQWANATFDRSWADEDADPTRELEARYAIEQTLDDIAASRAELADANHLLYLVKANQAFITGHGDSLEEGLARIEAPTLILYSEDDLVFAPQGVRQTAELIEADGTEVELVSLEGNRGHLDGVVAIDQAGDRIRSFLAE